MNTPSFRDLFAALGLCKPKPVEYKLIVVAQDGTQHHITYTQKFARDHQTQRLATALKARRGTFHTIEGNGKNFTMRLKHVSSYVTVR